MEREAEQIGRAHASLSREEGGAQERVETLEAQLKTTQVLSLSGRKDIDMTLGVNRPPLPIVAHECTLMPLSSLAMGASQAKLDDTQKKLDAVNNRLRLAEDDLEKSEERGDAAEDKVTLLLMLFICCSHRYTVTPSFAWSMMRMRILVLLMLLLLLRMASPTPRRLLDSPMQSPIPFPDKRYTSVACALQAEAMEAELAKATGDLKSLKISHNQASNDQEEGSSKVAEYKAKLNSVSRLEAVRAGRCFHFKCA